MAARSEKWADVVGYEGMYSVSDRGSIRSEPRTIILNRNGKKVRHRHRERMLKPGKAGDIQVVCLSRDNKQQMFSVANLVMTAHGPERPTGCRAVKHKDGDHSNNDIRNLYWETPTIPGPDDTKAWRSLADRLMPGCSLEAV